MKKIFKTALVSLIIFCLLLQSFSVKAVAKTGDANQSKPVVTPPSQILNLQPGESGSFTITVTPHPTPIQRIDALFLFDVTSSMANVLEQAKLNGKAIMNALQSDVFDTAFGVASFCDYPGSFNHSGYSATYGNTGDYPWQLDQDISIDKSDTENAINNLYLHDGQDGPEDYTRALFETLYNVNWRPGTKHVVVLFGDAPTHDTSFYSKNYGVDPGLDAVAGTEDDLTFDNTVKLLKTQGIIVLPVNSDLSGSLDVKKSFDYIASETGGQVYNLGDSTLLAQTVSTGLRSATSSIRELTLIPDERFRSWVKFSPERISDFSLGASKSFEVKITVPESEYPKSVAFDILVSADGSVLGKTSVYIEIGLIQLDGKKLIAEKEELIQDLKEFSIKLTIINADSPIEHLVGYEAENDVAKWIAGLQEKELSPAELDAVYRLTRQEEGMKRAWDSFSKNTHIGVSQFAHTIGLVVSAIGAWKLAQKFLSKKITGSLVSYLERKALSKLIGMLNIWAGWITEAISDKSREEVFSSKYEISVNLLQSAIENSLKTTNFSKATATDFIGVILEYFIKPFEIGIGEIYISQTNDEIAQALDMAQSNSARSLSLSYVQEQAPKVKSSIEVLLSPVENRTLINEAVNNDTEAQQEKLKFISEGLSFLSAFLAVTGFGAAVSAIAGLVSLCIKAFDAGMSTTIAIESYKNASEAWNAALQMTDVTFATYVYDDSALTYRLEHTPVTVSFDPDTLHDLSGVRVTTINELGIVTYLHGSSAQTVAQLNQVHQGVNDFNDLLQQMMNAVETGDKSMVEGLVQELMVADDQLSLSYETAEAPIYHGAADLLTETDSAFNLAYSNLGKAALHFSGEGAILYMYILGWLNEPENMEIQTSLINQISTVQQSNVAYEQVIADARPMVEAYVQTPSVIVSKYSFPDEMAVGRRATLTLQVHNISTNPAENVIIKVNNPGGDTTNIIESEIGNLGGNETREIEIQFFPRSTTGYLGISIDTSNGFLTHKLISYLAAASTGGNGIGFALILLIVFGGGISIFTISNRKRSKSVKASLTMINGESIGKVFIISGDNFTIGRGSGSHLRLLDTQVSRTHARLRFAQGKWFIQDQDSQNGTFVNGIRISAVQLSNRDQIRIGSSLFTFLTGGK